MRLEYERVPQRDPERARWLGIRLFYYGALTGLFCAIAFGFGPRLVLFGRLTSPTPADFVPEAQQFVPIVRAMKAYEQDHGRRPNSIKELTPDYLPSGAGYGTVLISGGEFRCFGAWNHLISYTFPPGPEGWDVSGPWVHGRIPLPPVTAGPSSAPSTGPAPLPAPDDSQHAGPGR